MHNTYITSSISLRTKCSLSSLSFNDHSCYLRNESFHKTPLLLCQSSSCCNCCSCCCCCDFTRRVPVNPSLLLYGLRQSTLVQLKPSRRFMLGGGDLCYDRVPVGRVGRDSYGVSCNVKEKRIIDGIRRMGGDRFGSKYLNGRSKRRCSVGEIEAEVMLSLLAEDIDDACYDSYEIVEVKKRENACDQSYIKDKNARSGHLKSNSKFEFKSDRNKSGEERSKRKVKNERSSRDENRIERTEGSTLKFEFESDRNKSTEERSKRKVKNERSSRDENRIARTEGSNCSYYTCASDDELERNMELKRNEEEHMVDASIVSSSKMKRFGKGRTEAEHVEQLYTHIDDNQDREEFAKQESTVVGSYVGRSNVDWDLRKKSEKKLSEEVFVDKNEKLILAGKSSQEINKRVSQQDIGESMSRNYCQDTMAINQEDKRHSSQQIYSTDAHMTSSSQKQFHDREEKARASVNLVQQKRDDTRIDVVNTSISRRQSETRLKKQDKTSTSIQSSVEEIKQAGFRRSSQEINDESYRYDEKKSTSRWKSEDMLKNREESSQILSSSRPEEISQHVHTGSGGGWRREQRKESLDVTSSTSVVHVSDTEKVTSSTSGSKSKMGSKESYITSSDGYDKIDGRRMQIGLSNEAQMLIKASSFHESTSNEASQSRLQQTRAQDHDNRSSHVMLMPPPLQLVAIEEAPKDKSESGSSSIYVYPQEEGTAAHNQVLIAHEDALGSADRHQKSSMHFVGDFVEKIRHEVPKATSESGSSFTSTYVNPQEEGSASHDQVYGGGRRSGNYGEAVNFSGHEDALGSADRLQKSSTHFVGNFVENIRHEVSTSDIINQQLVSETKLKDKIEKQMQELDSRPSSGASELKAPSDEKWDVPETSVQEYQMTETTHTPAEGSASTRSTIAKRNSKSLWNVVADIVQFKWGASHSQKHTSRAKSSVRSSSNESVTSEAWFSGRDPDSSDQSERVKATLINQKGPELVEGEDETSPITDDTSTSSSLGVLKTGSTSFGKISVSHEENLSSGGNGARNEDKPSSSLLVQSSLPSSFRQLRRSPVVDGSFSVTGKDKESASGVMEQQESSQSTKDGELKRRKLQRISQLPKDRFDEWEEAYMHETELRKMDEIYMQEALIEARKAADTWEVPVGAVLVQHGKIIARGFNLVEELRDSTAHAEMICIREASNVLKTWRLSETTLYVTLEPCPMCAGAILQARVDTVVWGAPNKLLGADGSWIRLFPNGGANGSEVSDKPPPPVHPFHPNMKVRRGVLATECADIMQQFFQLRRKKKEKSPETPTALSRLHISHHPSKIIGKMHGLFNVMFCL